MEKKVSEILPPECKLTKVEAEGLDVVVYLKDIHAFYASDQLIRKLAGTLRKRVLIRSDSSALRPPEEALKAIRQVVPQEAGVADVRFSPEFNEVIIEALKPGLVIGKGGATLKSIIEQTGWAPQVQRTPTMASSTIKGIRSTFMKEAASRKKFLHNLGKKICANPLKSDYVKVTALGGFQEVGRSCALVETPNSRILIDCGVNPETFEPTKAYPYLSAMKLELDKIDAVVITHAHLDHCGFVPYLFAYGYDGPVYCTPPTRDLMVLLQMDFINLAARANNGTPPYGIKDIQKQLAHIITFDYGEVMDITPEVKLTFYNAGHIIGSAQVHLHIGEGLHNLVFSGDMKYGFTRLFDQASTQFPRIETLFMESTYGGRNDIMPNRYDTDARLTDLIRTVIDRRGKVLIPVFSVGRSQEIMLVLEEYATKHPDVNFPVYIDGMVLEASAIHTAYPEYLRHNIQRRILSNDSPFENKIFVPAKGDRKEIAEGDPAVVLAPSGMMSGGPVLEYLRLMADNPKNALFFVGYQSALSFGRKLQRGLKEVPMTGDDGRTVSLKINMETDTVEGFSGHSDRNQLINYVKAIRPGPERVFTLHGDENKCEDLARSLNKMMPGIEARSPMDLDSIRLR
ncbi:MAG: beta-CASP ribonuclease aCPSF1 [Candidatus Micrarchaeota archaeon]|nr:beta-CASP ribonuclease aCPSF1 [Candidatus Micrarchaeota archaeon]